MLKKKVWANFQRIIELFTQKLSLCSQKYGFGIRDRKKPIPDPGFTGQKGTGSRIRIRNTAQKFDIIKMTKKQPTKARPKFLDFVTKLCSVTKLPDLTVLNYFTVQPKILIQRQIL
jgi:hypothetical protein